MKNLFITGIGTDIGKTVTAAILVRALQADYWKPIQCGSLDKSDSRFVQELTGCTAHPERFRLSQALSPHAAAAHDGVTIKLNDFSLPKTDRPLIIEGAGGVMVPLNHESLMVDLIVQLKTPVVLVSQNYLGSINHTLLSIEALLSHRCDLRGIIFNGAHTPASEDFILEYSKLPCLGRVPALETIDRSTVERIAKSLSVAGIV